MEMKKEYTNTKSLAKKLFFGYLKLSIIVYLISIIIFSIVNGKLDFGIEVFRKTEVFVPYLVSLSFEFVRIINSK